MNLIFCCFAENMKQYAWKWTSQMLLWRTEKTRQTYSWFHQESMLALWTISQLQREWRMDMLMMLRHPPSGHRYNAILKVWRRVSLIETVEPAHDWQELPLHFSFLFGCCVSRLWETFVDCGGQGLYDDCTRKTKGILRCPWCRRRSFQRCDRILSAEAYYLYRCDGFYAFY